MKTKTTESTRHGQTNKATDACQIGDANATAKDVPKFNPGSFYMTPGVRDAVTIQEIGEAILRHLVGDWGEVDSFDRKANDENLKRNGRILSSYKAGNGTKFWIITEGDRSATTLLLPNEY